MLRKWTHWNIPDQAKEKEDRPVECQTCGWTGKESDLVEVKDMSKDFELITKERGCPKCRSLVLKFVE